MQMQANYAAIAACIDKEGQAIMKAHQKRLMATINSGEDAEKQVVARRQNRRLMAQAIRR
ncbi:MAG: hypothetical protein M1608_17405 [Candidatus Omnitrophica bacterium]|nr:hypothetical protein [Candidatus Omnitrophota bacterium]